MKTKAIFFDIDGTLRDFQTLKIPDSAKEALRRAKEAGLLLFIATGRHRLEIEEENLLEDLEFDGWVTLNGQYCLCGDQVVYDLPISREAVEEMLVCLREEEFACMFMEADRMYINRIDREVEEAQAEIGTRIPQVADVTRAGNHCIYQIIPYITEEKEAMLKPRIKGCDFIRWHDKYGSDVIPKGGSKCMGIRKMAEHFGLSLMECAAIGDGLNDVTMIMEAGLGIAMGNGAPAAKAAADYVTDTIEQDGLQKAVFYILSPEHSEGDLP